jgi:hypothetical protein
MITFHLLFIVITLSSRPVIITIDLIELLELILSDDTCSFILILYIKVSAHFLKFFVIHQVDFVHDSLLEVTRLRS